VERHEKAEAKPLLVEIKSGNPTDYTQTCSWGTCVSSLAGCTKNGLPCTISSECVGGSCVPVGACGCPAPLVNSHQETGCSTVCGQTGYCNSCRGPVGEKYCWGTCVRSGCNLGTCGYECDVGYVWNPTTLKCELPVTAKREIMDGFVFADFV